MTDHATPRGGAIHPQLTNLLASRGFNLNRLQNNTAEAWHNGDALIVASAAGSGKTTMAVFLLIDSLLNATGTSKPVVVLLTPSETEVNRLCRQIQPFTEPLQFTLTSLYTTSDFSLYNERASQLRTSTDIVVSTPDRFLVHLKVGNIRAQEVVLLITDDVDRMCDAGQCNDLEKICLSFPPNTIKQLFMSNVNKPSLVQRITSRMVRNDDHEVLDFIG